MTRAGWTLRTAAVALITWQSGHAMAATYPIDDRTSTPYESTTKLEWDSIIPRRGAAPTLTGKMAVQVRLDVHAWQRRMGRIYLKLQNLPLGTVTATWTTHGRLLQGSVRSGERALVYSGPIQSNAIEDNLALTIQTDGRSLTRMEQLNFSFEIDVN